MHQSDSGESGFWYLAAFRKPESLLVHSLPLFCWFCGPELMLVCAATPCLRHGNRSASSLFQILLVCREDDWEVGFGYSGIWRCLGIMEQWEWWTLQAAKGNQSFSKAWAKFELHVSCIKVRRIWQAVKNNMQKLTHYSSACFFLLAFRVQSFVNKMPAATKYHDILLLSLHPHRLVVLDVAVADLFCCVCCFCSFELFLVWSNRCLIEALMLCRVWSSAFAGYSLSWLPAWCQSSSGFVHTPPLYII